MKRSLVALVCVLLWASPTFAAIGFVANVMTTGTTHSGSINCAAANILVAGIGLFSTDITTGPVDSSTNTWSVLNTYNTPSGGNHTMRLYYVTNPTVTSSMSFWSTGGSNQTLGVACFSGADTSAPFDQQNGGIGSGTTASPGNVTPSANDELLVTAVGTSFSGGITFTISSGWTITDQRADGGGFTGFGLAYQILSGGSGTPITATWTGSGSMGLYGTAIATFKSSGGASPASHPCSSLRLLGVGCEVEP